MEDLLGALLRAVAAAVALAAWVIAAVPHLALLAAAVIAAWATSGLDTALALLTAVAVTLTAWAILHRRSLALTMRLLGRWRSAIWGRRTWRRTVRALQLDAQDGQRLRAPRVKKVKAS